MAKKVHAISLKGDYYHVKKVVAEYDKKSETTEYFNLDDILKEFDNKQISITIKEEDAIPSVEQPFDDEE
jgi:hypothetical protein